MIVSLEAFTAAFFWIPKAALGAIIMMSVVHMVEVDQVKMSLVTELLPRGRGRVGVKGDMAEWVSLGCDRVGVNGA